MEFYKESLIGEITLMQTFGDSPVDVPEESQDQIFNSELRVGDLCIKASPMLGREQRLPTGAPSLPRLQRQRH